MSLVSRIVRRLTAAGLKLPLGEGGYHIRRTYAGRHQENAGAWLWMLLGKRPNFTLTNIGSQWPATELVKAKSWDVSLDKYGDIDIDPGRGPGDKLHVAYGVGRYTPQRAWPGKPD